MPPESSSEYRYIRETESSCLSNETGSSMTSDSDKFAYNTAALNAAHSDHIFLFKDPLQLETMLRNAGFQPLGLQEEIAAGWKPRNITPSLAGFLCEKRT